MKTLLLSAFAGLMLLSCQLSGQVKVHMNDCSWITVSVLEGPDGLPVSTTEIGPGPAGYYLFYSDASENMLLMEGEIGSGLRQGLWKFYNPDGTLYCRCHYANGQMNGLYELFNSDGLVTTSVEMLNDSPVENH